jgi:hypothetical protein
MGSFMMFTLYQLLLFKQTKEDAIGGHVTCRREIKKFIKNFLGKPEWKRLLGRPRGRWKDNMKWIIKK